MTVLQFGQTERPHQVDDPKLVVDFQPPDMIQRGVGLHRLRFPVKLDSRGTLPVGIPLYIGAQVSIGGSGDWLGFAQVDQPIVNHDQPFEERVTLPISDEQLAVLEDRRAGADLTFHVQFHVTLGYPRTDGPALWPSSSNHNQQLLIQGGSWERLLAQTSSGFSLAIVVPVPLGQDSAAVKAGDHLRTALRKLTAGEYDDAVVSARKAIEALGSPRESEKAIVSTTKADERTLVQRSTMLRHALFNLASPAAHGDESASEIHWDRAGAMSVIAGVSALVATWNRQ